MRLGSQTCLGVSVGNARRSGRPVSGNRPYADRRRQNRRIVVITIIGLPVMVMMRVLGYWTGHGGTRWAAFTGILCGIAEQTTKNRLDEAHIRQANSTVTSTKVHEELKRVSGQLNVQRVDR